MSLQIDEERRRKEHCAISWNAYRTPQKGTALYIITESSQSTRIMGGLGLLNLEVIGCQGRRASEVGRR